MAHESNTITKETLERFFDSAKNLSSDQKQELRKEFAATKGSRDVLDKAVRQNGGQIQHKAGRTIHHK